MNKQWIRLILLAIMCCVGIIGAATSVQAVEEEKIVQTYSQSLNAVSMSGYQATNYQYFEIEEYWQIHQAFLKLQYDFSQLTDEQRSSITLYMNGTPFHSFRPVDDHAEISVELPHELMVVGVNTLMIEGSRTTMDQEEQQLYNVCEVEQYRDHWLTIKDSSSIALEYTNEPLALAIDKFYSRFVGLDTVKFNKHAVVVNASTGSKALESALYSITGLAKEKSDGNKPIPLLALDDQEVSKKELLIYVSRHDELPQAIAEGLNSASMEQEALIQLLRMNEQYILVVTSNNEELLVKAGRYIANQDLMLQTAGNSKKIDASTETATPPVQVGRMIQLTENGDRIVGPMHQEKNYFVELPANQAIAQASKIKIDMRYSKNLNFNRSLVTVLINDKPIGSKKLYEAMANQDTLELAIPSNLDVNGNFTVTVAFDLEIESMPCTVSQDQMPWAFIDSSSVMQLNAVERHDLLFNYYPSNFMRQGGFNAIALVLPEKLERADYKALANVFHLLGRYTGTNLGELQVFDDSVDRTMLENKQLIALGSYDNNQLLREVNNELYFKYDEQSKGFRSNEKKSLELEYSKTIGSIQLLASPYSSGYGMLVITGPTPQYYELASQLLASEDNKWKLYGDAVITDSNKQIFAYRFQAGEQLTPAVVNILEREDVLTFIISALLTITLAIVALLLLTRKYWRKRRKNHETISKQLNI